MKLEKLFLRKEELPILNGSAFQIPIHPKLLDPTLKINEDIAENLFSKVKKGWHDDLKRYINTLEESEEKDRFTKFFLNSPPPYWALEVNTAENGLAIFLRINRNFGGTLSFGDDSINCRTTVPGEYIKFSKEKAKEFQIQKEKRWAHIYSAHNIDDYPAALFLRNWAILYMNEVFKKIF
jgi:hypothetical protein